MDVEDVEALGARPRRQRRPPLRYEDYDVDYRSLGAHGHGHEVEQEKPYSYITPRHAPAFTAELDDIQHERLLLQQSQQCMSAGLAELKAVRADMIQLVNTARTLQQAREPHHPDTVDEDRASPPPPPRCSNGEDAPPPSIQPMVERLERLMSELQVMRNETLAAKQDWSPLGQPLSAQQASRSTYPSSTHGPIVTPRPAWSSWPPPPPRFTSTPYGMPGNPTAFRPQPTERPTPPAIPIKRTSVLQAIISEHQCRFSLSWPPSYHTQPLSSRPW